MSRNESHMINVLFPNSTDMMTPETIDVGGLLTTRMPQLDTTTGQIIMEQSALQRFSEAYQGIHGYFSTIVCIFGIISNVLNIIVLTRRHMRSPTNYILTALAIADILTMSTYPFFAIYLFIISKPMCEVDILHTAPWIYFIQFHNMFLMACHIMAMWLTVALAVFRYIFVCQHQLASTMCTMQRAKLAVIIIVIATVVLSAPYIFLYKVKDLFNEDGINNANATTPGGPLALASTTTTTTSSPFPHSYTNNSYSYSFNIYNNSSSSHNNNNNKDIHNVTKKASCYWVVASDFATNYPVFQVLMHWLFMVIKIVPCILLAFLSALLVSAMQNAKKRRARLLNNIARVEHDSSNENNRTTMMLIAVVICFIVTEMPQGIVIGISAVSAHFFTNVYVYLGDMMDILVLVNSAVNFILYCIMSQQFRDTFMSLFVSKHLPPIFQRVKKHPKETEYSVVRTETTLV